MEPAQWQEKKGQRKEDSTENLRVSLQVAKLLAHAKSSCIRRK